MSTINHGKSTVHQSKRILWTTLNLFIIFALLLSSCGTANQKSTVVQNMVGTPLSTPERSASNYQPPVFTHQVPVLATNGIQKTNTPSLSLEEFAKENAQKITESGEKLKTDSEANAQKIKSKVSVISNKAVQVMNSFKPAPNPIRKVKPSSGINTYLPNKSSLSDYSMFHLASAFSLLSLFAGNTMASNTFIVTTLTDTDDGVCDSNCSLREAIYAANDANGPSTITFNVSGTLQLSDTLPYISNQAGLTIDGSGQNVTIIGGNSHQIMYVSDGVAVSINELSFSSGIIYSAGSLSINNSFFDNSTKKSASLSKTGYIVNENVSTDEEPQCSIYSKKSLSVGGATLTDDCIYVLGDLSISGSTLIRSGSVNYGTLTVTGSTFTESGVWSTEELTVSGSQFTDGYAMSEDAAVSVTNCEFKSTASSSYVYSGAKLTVKSSTFDLAGGGWLFSVGDLEFTDDSKFNSNGTGDDIYSEGALTFSGTFTSTGYSAYIWSEGNLNVSGIINLADGGYLGSLGTTEISSTVTCTGDCSLSSLGSELTMTDTSWTSDGYSYLYSYGDFSFKQSTFSAIQGSLYCPGKLDINDGTISLPGASNIQGNTSISIENSAINGASTYSDGEQDYSNSNFIDNEIASHILLKISGETTFSRVSFEGDATSSLLVDFGSSLTASNSTLSDCTDVSNKGTFKSVNNTFYSCGVSNQNVFYLDNSILAQNSSCQGGISGGKNNFIETSGTSASSVCGLVNGVNGNIIGSNANLNLSSEPLTGGHFYYELTEGSSAIDAGDDSICTVDPVDNLSQNGVTRPVGAHCDIGSYEAAAKKPVDNGGVVSVCGTDGCINTANDSQKKTPKPINIRTGGYQYSVEDISIATTAGSLSFSRDYASLGTQNATILSPGWTGNQDTRLILPNDPEGKQGAILFKLHSSNRYPFYLQDNGIYKAATGVLASLVETTTEAATNYVITDSKQNTYTFDANGTLLKYDDPNANEWDYVYDTNNRLSQITANGGASWLNFSFNLSGKLASVSDQANRQVSYTYDSNGDLVTVTDVLGKNWTYTYNSSHEVLSVVDPDGVILERNEYDDQGRAIRQYDGSGNLTVRIQYNSDGTSTVTDALGNNVTYTFDSLGTATAVTNTDGSTTNQSYLANFRPFRSTDSLGGITDLSWSADGANLTRVVDNEGNQTSFAYDNQNNLTSVVDPLNNLTTYDYTGTLLQKSTDALGNATNYTYTTGGQVATVTDPLGNTTSYTYDTNGQKTSMQDALGNQWQYSYDDLGRLVNTTDPAGHITHNEYDAAGHVIRSVQNYDPNRPQNDANVWNIETIYTYDSQGNQLTSTDTYGKTTAYEYDASGRLIKTTDPEGEVTTSTYDQAGNLISSTDAAGNKTQYTYDAEGRLTATKDALGNTTRTVYNTDGTVTEKIDALGHTTSYEYDTLKRVSKVTKADGNSTQNTYDAAGNIVATTDELGRVTHFEYDALGRLIKTTDPQGNTTENFYNEAGQLVQTKDALGNATTFAYDAAGRQISQTDAQGNVTRYEYDSLGRKSAQVDPSGNRSEYTYDDLDRVVAVKDALGNTTHTQYDALGRKIASTDALGNVTTFAYDDLGRLIKTTNALGNSTQVSYDVLGRVITSTDELGRVTRYVYDALGHTVEKTAPNGGQTTYSYDANGNLLTTTDANGHTVSAAYDILGRDVSQTDANGLMTTFAYDAVGNKTATTNPENQTTHFTYDSLNRQVEVTDPLGNVTRQAFDAAGNLIQKTDAKGVITKYEYNSNGRLSAVIENAVSGGSTNSQTNVRTEYTYDANGNLLTVLDANGHTARAYTYDALNREASEADALGIRTQFGYDANGNQIRVTKPTSEQINYVYNAINELTAIHYPNPSQDVLFTYDAAGQRTQMTDGNGNTSWEYNDTGQPTTITDPNQKTVGYSYDSVGNRTRITYPDGKTVDYSYDNGNRLSTVTDWRSLITKYAYTDNSRISSVSLPNGVTTAYQYNAAGQLTSLTHSSATTELASYQYTYDADGNRTQAIEKLLGPKTIPTVMVSIKDSRGSVMDGVTVYAFDGTTYTGYSAITDSKGIAKFILPEGNYRFRADQNGVQYFSSDQNNCTVLGCTSDSITLPFLVEVTVSVADTLGQPLTGLPVYAFTGTTYTGFTAITDGQGQVTFDLPEGNYHFRADKNNEQFFSSVNNDCSIHLPWVCYQDSITVPQFTNVTVTVKDTNGVSQANLPVYAFDGDTYTGYHAVTDENGQAVLLMHEGNYRFRTDLDGQQYFSSTGNDCTILGCTTDLITVPVFGQVAITVKDSAGTTQAGLPVYAFSGDTYAGFSGTTDHNGNVTFTLPQGDYRFRTDLNGGQFFSSGTNSCSVPSCTTGLITVPQFANVTVTVTDSNNNPLSGLPVYAFDSNSYTGYNSTTDANGQAVLLLREGSYRFRTDADGQQYFSSNVNNCTVLGCTSANITVPASLPTATVTSTLEPSQQPTASPTPNGIPTQTVTDTVTPVPTTVPTDVPTTDASTPTPTLQSSTNGFSVLGNALSMAIQFLTGHIWLDNNGASNTTVTVTVTDSLNSPQAGLPVYAFDGGTYLGISGITDANGQAVFSLAAGNYRFRTDTNGLQYFSGASDTCTTPDCTADSIAVPVFGTVSITVHDSNNVNQSGLNVYAFDGNNYKGFNAQTDANGVALFTLPEGSYRFRADTHGLQYFSSTANDCTVPQCATDTVSVPVFGDVAVTVSSTAGTLQANLPVYAFDGDSYTGFSARTDDQGVANFTLPQGNYRFRADLNGAQYFDSSTNDCSLPGCTSAAITTPVYSQVTISVKNSSSAPLSGLPVYAFNGENYSGINGTTDENGNVTLWLPEGNYRFRSDLNGLQYFSSSINDCTVPGCSSDTITAAVFGDVTVTVKDSTGTAQANLPVYVFTGDSYDSFTVTTDTNGQATFNLPQGQYRFRTDLHGAQYFSSTTNDCTVTGCTEDTITTPVYGQVTVTAESSQGEGQADLPVYAFSGDDYSGVSGTTGKDGKATLWLPAGDYRFRADQFGLQFFSDKENDCTVPTCTTAIVKTLGMQQAEVDQTIEYTYDPLNRLTQASYDDGSYYTYTYDAVGNRLTQTTEKTSDTYTYMDNNWLSMVDNNHYSYDGDGNLRWDGSRAYNYDSADRLTQVIDNKAITEYDYSYDGLGNLLKSSSLYYPTSQRETTNYTLDIADELTQVLSDGTNSYAYGLSRISQTDADTTGYFLDDALGSVRQVANYAATDSIPEILLARSYGPYGDTIASSGDYVTPYGFTGEMTGDTGLVNLRARWYDPGTGRFLTKDTWNGNYQNPVTLDKWLYANINPVVYTDPSGNISENELSRANQIVSTLQTYGIKINVDWGEYRIFINPLEDNNSGLPNVPCGWSSGRWSLNELYIVLGAVENMNRAMNQRITQFIGPVGITKVPPSAFPSGCSGAVGCTVGDRIQLVDNNNLPKVNANPSDLTNYYITGAGSTTNFSQWVVVHELGHAWENHYGSINSNDVTSYISLSAQLVIATGGKYDTSGTDCKNNNWKPGCNAAKYYYGGTPARGSNNSFNPREDFAESVAAYVFPKQAQEFVNQYYNDREKRELLYYPDYTKTDRWKFIDGLVNPKP